MARSLAMYHGIPGRHRRMVAFYREFLGPGDLAFDVGAHVGSRVRAWRKLGARVVAVEPQPDCVRVLRLLFGRDPQVVLVTDALGAQPGTAQLAAGFALYGPSTILILTTGNGVNGFPLDRGSGDFVLTHPDMKVQVEAKDFTINMSNKRYWTPPIQRYIDELVEEGEKHRGLHFNMRWMGSMVADVYRLLISGGIFLYPWDSKVAGRPGKLRLLYEVNPISFLIEQAGGVSTTGTDRTMEIMPESLHQRSPAILGSKNEVERVISYHLEQVGRS